MNSTQPPQNTPATQEPAELKGSAVVGWFTAFAVIGFIAAALGLFDLFSSNPIDIQQGAVLLPAGISGGLFCLAVAKIIRCLHESSQRLLKIDREIINGQREIAKALQWMVDNWKQEASKPPDQQPPPV